MYCRNCGNKLPEGARFCGACGAEQKQSMVNADENCIPGNDWENSGKARCYIK